MKKIKHTLAELERRLRNPLLFSHPFNSIPEKVEKAIPEYGVFRDLFEKGSEQTKPHNLAFGLEAELTDSDKGYGGFYSAGFVPSFFSPMEMRREWEKDFNFYWPKDFKTDKFMRYIGSVNVERWPLVYHNLLRRKYEDWFCKTSFICGYKSDSDFSYFESLSSFVDIKVWIHFFASRKGDCETLSPDCHIRMTTQKIYKNSTPDDFDKPYHTKEQQDEFFRFWQDNKTTPIDDDSVNGPKSFFDKPIPRFYYDGVKDIPYSQEDVGIFSHGKYQSLKIFGIPHSQQMEKRYISPDSALVRGLVPMISFNDGIDDMTHQFYGDALHFDDISHTRAFCKLESSCT